MRLSANRGRASCNAARPLFQTPWAKDFKHVHGRQSDVPGGDTSTPVRSFTANQHACNARRAERRDSRRRPAPVQRRRELRFSLTKQCIVLAGLQFDAIFHPCPQFTLLTTVSHDQPWHPRISPQLSFIARCRPIAILHAFTENHQTADLVVDATNSARDNLPPQRRPVDRVQSPDSTIVHPPQRTAPGRLDANRSTSIVDRHPIAVPQPDSRRRKPGQSNLHTGPPDTSHNRRNASAHIPLAHVEHDDSNPPFRRVLVGRVSRTPCHSEVGCPADVGRRAKPAKLVDRQQPDELAIVGSACRTVRIGYRRRPQATQRRDSS